VDDSDKIVLEDGEPFNLEAFVLRVMSVCCPFLLVRFLLFLLDEFFFPSLLCVASLFLAVIGLFSVF
jgi:hypothetical protein